MCALLRQFPEYPAPLYENKKPPAYAGGLKYRYSSMIFLDNFLHPLPLLFHIPNQLELRSAAIQILPRSVDFKISIPLQIICQETHTTLKGHKDCAHRKHIQLDICQRIGSNSISLWVSFPPQPSINPLV